MENYFDDIRFINVARDRRCALTLRPFRLDDRGSLEFLRRGRMRYIVNGAEHVIQAPVAFWNIPGKTYEYKMFEDETRDQSWTDFTGPRAKRVVRALDALSPRGYLRVHKPIEFGQIFDEMIGTYQSGDPLLIFQVAVGLERLVGLVYEAATWAISNNPERAFFRSLAKEIVDRPFQDWDFCEQAKRVHMSYTNFRRLFRKIVGSAPHDYLLLCRARRASRELLTRDVPIKQIAYECGFSDIAGFSRLFKKKLGVTPSYYARSMKNSAATETFAKDGQETDGTGQPEAGRHASFE